AVSAQRACTWWTRLRHTTPRPDADERTKRHDRERQPIAILVVRTDRHELLCIAQPRVDETLAEHRACKAAELVAIDVDQVHASSIDEHVEIVAVADHDAPAVQARNRLVERDERGN